MPDPECNEDYEEDGYTWWSIEKFEYEGITNRKCVLVASDLLETYDDAELFCNGSKWYTDFLNLISIIRKIFYKILSTEKSIPKEFIINFYF